MKIIDGKEVSNKIYEDFQKEISSSITSSQLLQ